MDSYPGGAALKGKTQHSLQLHNLQDLGEVDKPVGILLSSLFLQHLLNSFCVQSILLSPVDMTGVRTDKLSAFMACTAWDDRLRTRNCMRAGWSSLTR